MNLFSKKNFLIALAAILVIALGIMAMSLTRRPKTPSFENEIKMLETQSDSDTIESIEKDLNDTELGDIDRELQDIEREVNQTN